MNEVAVNDFEVSYARFNALKTLSTSSPSRFEHARVGQLDVTRDSARADPYYNRILGLTAAATSDELYQAISWIEAGVGVGAALRVDVADGHGCTDQLTSANLQHVDTIVWLHGANAPGAELVPDQVVPLTAEDRPALRRLLEEQGPIADDLWERKSSHLCTKTFRWFAVFEHDEIVSAASVWIHADTAIFGSAFTRKTHRGQGLQLALLNHRRAVTGGNHYVDVSPDSTSYRNCRRCGFVDLERRQVWTRRLRK